MYCKRTFTHIIKLINDYMKITGNKNNCSAAINICFQRLFKLSSINSVKLTFYDKESILEPEGTRCLFMFIQISSINIWGKGVKCSHQRLLLATVMGAHHHVAVRWEVQSGRPRFVPADVRPSGRTPSAAGVVLLEVTDEGLPASTYTHHHLPLVQHLQRWHRSQTGILSPQPPLWKAKCFVKIPLGQMKRHSSESSWAHVQD